MLRPAEDRALLDALAEGEFDAAFGGARRDEEKSRAKERVYSFRDPHGQWDPKNQRPELWNLFNSASEPGRKHPRFPALQLDRAGRLAVHPPGEDPDRAAVLRQGARDGGPRRIQPDSRRAGHAAAPRRKAEMVMCRMRSLGCSPCTGAIRSDADTCRKSSKR